MHRGNKKKLSMFVSLAMMASLFAFAGPTAPVQAQVAPTFTNLLPLEGFPGPESKSVLSNRFDGVDRLIHLTLVATQGADTATWWVCPQSGTVRDVGAGDPTGCTLIGSDSSPTTPSPGTPGSDSAFEMFWDGAPLGTGAIIDILTRVCTGGACSSSEEKAVEVYRGDAAQATGVHNNRSGEKTEVCFQRAGDNAPAAGNNFACPAGWQPMVHGMLMQAGLVYHLKFRTDPDVSAPAAGFEPGVKSDTPPAAAGRELGSSLTQITQTVEFREWIASFTARPGGTHGDLSIWDSATTMNSFDQNYVFFAAVQEQVVLTFNHTFGAASPNCGDPDQAETNRLGQLELVTACLLDQFGTGQNGVTMTWESTGVGTLTCIGPGATATANVPGPSPQDGDTQRCTNTTSTIGGIPGLAQANLTNTNVAPGSATTAGGRNGSPGDQTVVACRDVLIPAGCAGNEPMSSGVKTWMTLPDHVFLVFEGTGDPADPCRTGDQAKNNVVGDQDTLLACVFDMFNRPASTAAPGHTGEGPGVFALAWTRDGACQAIGFVGSLATETGPDGRAMQDIRAVQTGACQIFVTLTGGAGAAGLTTTGVSKNASPDPGVVDHDDPRTIGLRRFRGPRLRPRRIRVVGRVRVANDHLVCVDQVPVRVQRRFLRGRGSRRFVTLRTITTGGAGVYRTNLRRPVRAHRIRVIAVPIKIGPHQCMRAVNSRRVRRR